MPSLPNDDASYSTIIIIKKLPKDIAKERNKIAARIYRHGVNIKFKTGPKNIKHVTASHKKRVSKAWFEKRAQQRREVAEAEHRVYKQGIKNGLKVLNQTK